jgi:hypothetical protein
MMDAKISAALMRLNEKLDAMRKEQQASAVKLLRAVERGLGDVESAVSMMHGYLDQATDSLFELQMFLTPGGDPREPMPTDSD